VLKNRLSLLLNSFDDTSRVRRSKPAAPTGVVHAGNVVLENLFSLYPLAKLLLSGSNEGSVVFLLDSDGTKTTMGQQPGESSLSTVLNLLASGMLSMKSGTSLSVQSTLSGDPSLRFAGGMGPSIIITLSGNGVTSAVDEGSALLSTIIQLLGSGTLTIGAASTLSNLYSIGGASRLAISGGTQQSLLFDLIGTLSTDSDSIVSLLFILNILQSKNFTLRVDKNKLFSLKIQKEVRIPINTRVGVA
jgi:hypothetical protein